MDRKSLESKFNDISSRMRKKPYILAEEYIPEEIFYRDEQIEDIIAKISGGHNIMLKGAVSTGKTTVTKWLFKILKESETKYLFIYQNCRATTIIQIITEIANALEISLQRNKPIAHHIKKIKAELVERGFERIYLCLDEIDFLLFKYNDKELLYLFANEFTFRLILISNTTDWQKTIGIRTLNRLQSEIIDFPAYEEKELRGILEQRIKLAFENNIIFDKEIDTIIDILKKTDNTIRDAFSLLNSIYDYKIIKGYEDIMIPQIQIESLLEEVENQSMMQRLEKYDSNIRFAMYCICNYYNSNPSRKNFETTDIVKIWNKKSKSSSLKDIRSENSIRRYLSHLEAYNWIKKTTNSRGEGLTSWYNAYAPAFNPYDLWKEFESYSMGK